jgi:hypothetical protein
MRESKNDFNSARWDGVTGNDRIDAFIDRFRKEDDCGITGLLAKANVLCEASRILSRDDFEWLCTVLPVAGLDRMFLQHLGERQLRLEHVGGSRLEAFALFRLLTLDRKDFEGCIEDLTYFISDTRVWRFLDDISDTIDTNNVVPSEDGSPPEVFGIQFSWTDPSPIPSSAAPSSTSGQFNDTTKATPTD